MRPRFLPTGRGSLQIDLEVWIGGDLGAWFLDLTHKQKLSLARIRALPEDINVVAPSSDYCLLIHNPTVLKQPTIERYKRVWNLHPGFLPYGRGFYPVPWAIIEDTPAGATLHEVVRGIDRGPIVYQREVGKLPKETCKELHGRVREAEKEILWNFLCDHPNIPIGIAQIGEGTHHYRREFEEVRTGFKKTGIGHLEPAQQDRLIRAFTFQPFAGLELP